MIIREYQDLARKNRFRVWFNDLDIAAAIKVTAAIERLAQGNTSSLKPLGEGVSEYRVDWGPGYRIYLGQDGDLLVILLGGGTKRGQDTDIANAKAAWREYKQKKAAIKRVVPGAGSKAKQKPKRRK